MKEQNKILIPVFIWLSMLMIFIIIILTCNANQHTIEINEKSYAIESCGKIAQESRIDIYSHKQYGLEICLDYCSKELFYDRNYYFMTNKCATWSESYCFDLCT